MRYFILYLLLLVPINIIFAQSESSVSKLAVSPDGHFVASAGNLELRIWDIETSKLLLDLRTQIGNVLVLDLSWHPNSNHLATVSDDGLVRVWNIADFNNSIGFLLAVFEPDMSGYSVSSSVDWSPDGQYIIVGGYGESPRLQLWNTTTYTLERELSLQIDITDVEWNPLISSNIVASIDSTIAGHPVLFDIISLTQDTIIFCDDVWSVNATAWSLAWNHAGTHLAVGYDDGRVIIVDTINCETTASMQTNGFVNTISWSSDGELIVTASNWLVQVWNASTGEFFADVYESPVAEFIPHTDDNIVIFDVNNITDPIVVLSLSEMEEFYIKRYMWN